MQARDVLITALTQSQHMLTATLSDLSDEDLQFRPVPKANHIAWQLGHLIASEREMLVGALPGAKFPELPAALKDQASGQSSGKPPAGGYLKKTDYLDWFERVRGATLAAVSKLNDADLDRSNAGPMEKFAPNLGALLTLISTHTMMHAGQFSVVRRALNKPVLF